MSDVYDIQSPSLKKRLLAVMSEEQADAALAALRPELTAWAEYENAVTWQTDCLSCANMLSSCIKETVRAETAEKELADFEENVVGDMNEKAIAAARQIARLEAQVAELRADLEESDRTADENLNEAIDAMRRFKEAYEQSEQQRQNALAEREEWRHRALAKRGAIHEVRAELKKVREAAARDESAVAARILHDAADRMEGARMDPDAVNFLHLLAERQVEGFFTDIPHPKDQK